MITEELINKAKIMGANDVVDFSIEQIVFDERTLLKCLYGCDGGMHYCPTVNDSITVKDYIDMIKKYKYGILICTDNLKDGQEISLELERDAFLKGFHFAFSASECCICDKCTKPDNLPCRFPEKRRIPLYALGIDVYKTVKNVGWELSVVQEKDMPRKNITAIFIE